MSFKYIKKRKGAVLPIVALVMVFMLFGFAALAVDVGSLYAERRKMVAAADAAALAGAQELRDSSGENIGDAISIAKQVAIDNGADEDYFEDPSIEPIIVEKRNVKTEDGKTDSRQVIEVNVKTNKELFFARFLGFDDSNVTARAVATWGYIKQVKGGQILPIFVLDEEFESGYGNLHDNKVVTNKGISDANWGFVEIGGKGANVIKEHLSGVHMDREYTINAILDNEQGRVQAIDVPLEDRMKAAAELPTVEARRQYMSGLVPIIEKDGIDDPGNSKLKLPIKYFAVYLIKDVIKNYDKGNENKGIPGKGTGSPFALDDNFNRVASPKTYKDDGEYIYDKGTIVGEFTGDVVELSAIVVKGDQEPPSSGNIDSAKYHKLIE